MKEFKAEYKEIKKDFKTLSSSKDEFYMIASIKQPTPTVVIACELMCHMFQYRPKK